MMSDNTDAELSDDDGQERERKRRWDTFVGGALPRTISEIFPPNALQDLLRGFFLKIRRGVSLVYARRNDSNVWSFENAARIDPFNVEEGTNAELLNPICFELRRCREIQNRCVQCDQQHVNDYLTNTAGTANSYHCWLGLVDLLLPVELEGHVVAFVFAGQIVPDSPAQSAVVRSRIVEVGGKQRDTLINLLEEQQRQRAQSHSTADLETQETKEQLRTFVKALELIMEALHAAHKRACEGEFLRYWDSNLPAVDHTEEPDWWRRVARLAQDFLSQLGMRKVTLFVRSGKTFDQRWPCGDDISMRRLSTREVLHAVEPERLTTAGRSGTKHLAETIMPDAGEVSFYRTRTTSADAQPGLLFVVEGHPLPHFSDLAEQFLARISSRTAYAALTFQLKRMHSQYVQTVSDAAHDFRHPLQMLEFNLAELLGVPVIKQDDTRAAELHKIKVRLRQAQEQTLSLQKKEKDPVEVLNLVELLDEVIEFMAPMAVAHPCPIRRHGSWPDSVLVKGNGGQLFRVFMNLIDNAIKYSFMGSQYDVRIQVFPPDGNANGAPARVTIRNFGVGIPADLLVKIRERGGRAEVPDPRRQREGTGIGLSIVKRFLTEHGGSFDIESTPESDDNSRMQARRQAGASKLGLRYATTVTVRLKPIRES
jgi:signal transduction histidine kinase/ligand-binding sensor protein